MRKEKQIKKETKSINTWAIITYRLMLNNNSELTFVFLFAPNII